MAVAKRSETGGEGRKAPRTTALVLRSGKTGVFTDKGGGRAAQVQLKADALELVSRNRGFAKRLLESYVAAKRKAQASGEPVDLTIKVTPEGDEPSITETATGDALDVAMAKAKARGAARIADILASADMLSARDFGHMVGLSHETVNQKRKAGDILGLEGPRRGVRYPRWQITEGGGLLPGLRQASQALGGGPWTVYRFLLTPHNELSGATGLQALKAGRVDEVMGVIRNIDHGVFA